VGLENNGVKISCEGCTYLETGGDGGFDVSVPLSTAEPGVNGVARLHCVVGPDSHRVELVSWVTSDGRAIAPPEAVEQRVAAALRFIAERRICGRHQICPTEVIRVVKGQTGT
jgi:hypothetical protein